MLLRRIIVCLTLLSLVLNLALSQSVTGTFQGRVSDPGGAIVIGAAITATHVPTGQVWRTTTNASGEYFFPALPTGEFRLDADLPGFKRAVREGVTLELNQNARVDFTLEIGKVTEEVRVTAEAALVDTRQAQLGGTVDERRVQDLPLNGRNVYDLVTILPGVSTVNTGEVLDGNGTQMVVNGNRSRANTFLLDGAFNNDTWRNQGNAAPNPDAVEQFRLITSNMNAEYGRSPGAVVNVITKSGTNEFHGALYEYFRNSALNARNFFQPTVNPIRQNQFGVSLGGPVIQNKTFFFGSWQSLRVRQAAFTNGGRTPTAAERSGDFSGSPANQLPVDPTTNTPFPNGRIPLNRFDPVAVNIIDRYVPLPNTPDGRFEAFASRQSNEDQWTGKLDHQLTDNQRLNASFFYMRNNVLDPFSSGTQVTGYGALNTQLWQTNGVVGHDWIVSPTMLNQFRFSTTTNETFIESPIRDSWAEFGSQVQLGAPDALSRPPQIFVTGRWQMGVFAETYAIRRSYGLQETLTITRGNHSLKLGAWALFNRYRELSSWLTPGQVRFNGNFTRNTLSDFYLGIANSFRQNNGVDIDMRGNNYHFFLQDDWRISRKLTLNLGLRYELNPPFVETEDRMSGVRFNQQSSQFPTAPLGMAYPNDPGVPRGTVATDRNDFAPRVGLAYDVFGNGKTAIRAGWGMFYSAPFSNLTAVGQPFIVDLTVFGTPSLVDPWRDFPGGNPYPYTLNRQNPQFATPLSAAYMNPPFRSPYVQHMSFTLEQQLRQDLAVSIAYVGNTSRKLIYRRDSNAALFGPGATAGNVNARRPYLPGTFGALTETSTAMNANYNSLQATVNKRLSNRFTILGSYTLGKAIDEGGDEIGGSLQDNNNRALERGPSNSDARHILAASWVYQIPEWNHLGWAGRYVLGNWNFTGIARFQSGTAYSILAGRDTNLDGSTAERGDLVGNPTISGNRPKSEWLNAYFNTAAFAIPATGTVGNTGRNILYGPGSAVWNISTSKDFPIRESWKLQFRSEFFNAFNRANFGNPNGTITDGNFGRILGAGQGRVIQFALRLTF
jgi:hypothetical protein